MITNFQNKLPGSCDMNMFGKKSLQNRKFILKVVRNKKSKFFSHRYLIEVYETNRMSHVPHLYDVVNLLK